ncbi:hypothetical protein EZS27_005338 [termite gut metagenome]|uniref:DUF1320 domain-containing protein n=1 Tax=termite gut metagenome TaxID=433724 RepID=A0A5J4SLY2_9ZZZZ
MKYINKGDLLTLIQEPLLNSSIMGEDRQPDEGILDTIEATAIDLAKGYLIGSYQVDKIFDADPVLRNGVLVQVISMIVIYRAVRRNAARKVPEDFTTYYEEAVKILERIQSKALALQGMPEVTAPDGSVAELMYGNNTNPDFFI